MGSCSAPRQGLPGDRQDPPWFPRRPFKNKVLKSRPRQEELAGKANQGPGKRSLPGRDKTLARGACREGHSRHTKKACRDAPCVPARPGEQQAPKHDKTTTAARSLPRETPTSCPRSSTPANVSLWDSPRAHVAGGRAARGTWWQAEMKRSPSWQMVAFLTVTFCTV